jgi:uncharacterized protein RhaS with RHS repeats
MNPKMRPVSQGSLSTEEQVMYDPTVGRWMTQDPLGFDAGDANLYRYVGDNPVGLTDPSGLRPPHHPTRTALWRWDWPDTSTKGDDFARAWLFGEDEKEFFNMGCIGLCAIRVGSYRGGIGKRYPMFARGVRCFSNLKDALAEQRRMQKAIDKEKRPLDNAVLFAVESKNKAETVCKYLDKEKRKVDPDSLGRLNLLEPYDFATAFQKEDGTIVYWERMPYGRGKNPDLVVNRTKGHVYPCAAYCVVVTDSKFQPYTVAPDDHPFRRKPG